jgi:hypothetical protein
MQYGLVTKLTPPGSECQGVRANPTFQFDLFPRQHAVLHIPHARGLVHATGRELAPRHVPRHAVHLLLVPHNLARNLVGWEGEREQGRID